MSDTTFDEERLNQDIRRFLKKVGITSQREIDKAVRAAYGEGRLEGRNRLPAHVVLEIPELGLKVAIDEDIRWCD